MEKLAWDPRFSVGVKEMDNQHQRWFALTNAIQRCVTQGAEESELRKVLNELAEFTRTHFKQEESLMDSHGYPGAESHKGNHRQFLDYLERAMESLSNQEDTERLAEMLRSWINTHVLILDKGYGSYIRKKR